MPETLPEQRWCKTRFGQKPYIVLTLGTSKKEKNWLPKYYTQLADYIAKRGYSVVLCGGFSNEEMYLNHYVETQCSTAVLIWLGKPPYQLLSLIKHAQAFIGPDSALYLANLCGTPAIGLHAIHPATRTGAYRYQDYAVCIYEDLYQRHYNHKKRAWRTPLKLKSNG